MRSGHITTQMDAYLEGLLDPASQEQLQQHAAVCGPCRRALQQAQEARQYVAWLRPTEAPPVPGPDFYARVQQSIEKRLSRNWFEVLGEAMRPRLAYPIIILALLTAAWTLTSDVREPEEGLAAIEYPATEFAQMAFTMSDRELSEDLVMMNLVDLPLE